MTVVKAVDTPALTVGDMDRALAFYRDACEMKVVEVKGADSEWSPEEQRRWHAYHEQVCGVPGAQIQAVFLQAPDGSALELVEYRTGQGASRGVRPYNEGGLGLTTLIVGDSEAALARLVDAGALISGEPVPYELDGVASATTYLADPDGNALCLFEVRGEGAEPTPLFKSVDAPAVTVADMDRALGFYRDLLGFSVAEVKGWGSEWPAEEQARWNAYIEQVSGIPGAALQAIYLNAPDGSPLELVAYRESAVPDRPREVNEPGVRIAALLIEDSVAVVERLREAGVDVLADPVHYVLDGTASYTTYLRDPDGNFLCLFEVLGEHDG